MHSDECLKSELLVSAKDEVYVSELFKMLGEPGRLRIVCALAGTRMCVAHLAEQVGMKQSALSHQLRNLRNSGIVKSEKSGKQVFYSLDDEHINSIIKQAVSHAAHRREEL